MCDYTVSFFSRLCALCYTAPTSIFSSCLFQSVEQHQLTRQFNENMPFKHLHLTKFLDDDFARALLLEVKQLDYNMKSSDLYEFAQSEDLKGIHTPIIEKFKDMLYSQTFRNFLQTVTGIELTGLSAGVDMSMCLSLPPTCLRSQFCHVLMDVISLSYANVSLHYRCQCVWTYKHTIMS